MSASARLRGFTLVELMVAMVLTLVIMGVVMYGFNTSSRVSRRSLGTLDIQTQIPPVLALLQRDAENAVLYDEHAPVYKANIETGRIDTTVQVADQASPKHRLWVRYQDNVAVTDRYTGASVRADLCEVVFLTALPLDKDGDGHPDHRTTHAWVRWVAERVKMGSFYRLRLTRQLPRFLGNNYFVNEEYKQLAEASPFIRAREIAGDDKRDDNVLPATDTNRGSGSPLVDDNANRNYYDPDRYFGPEQVLYEVVSTPDLNDAPVWNLFVLSNETKGIVGTPANMTVFHPKNNTAWTTTAGWKKWEYPVGIHFDLDAYATNRMDQSIRYKGTAAFPPPPAQWMESMRP